MLSDKNNINLYESIAKSFIKETKAPLPLYRQKEFEYYLDLLEPVTGLKTQFESYFNLIQNIGIDDYSIMKNILKEDIINSVIHKDSYVDFINSDFTKYSTKFEPVNKGTNLLTMENINKKWISVDMVTANFNSFRTFNDDLVDGHASFEDWICSFNNGYLFKDIKILRQVIFGNLNPKRNQTIQKYYMSKLIELILLKENENLRVVVLGADEILFEYTEGLHEKILESIEELKTFEGSKFKFRTEIFELRCIHKDIKDYGFVKVFDDGSEKFLGVSKNIFAQSYKYYKGLEVTEKDLKFFVDGMVATFEEPLYKKYEK